MFRSISRFVSAWLTTAVALLASPGCENPLPPPEVGTLLLASSTTGGDPDRNGYRVVVDGQATVALAVGGGGIVMVLSVGTHSVLLEDVAPNCNVIGDNPARVDMEAGVRINVAFKVDCHATGVRVVVMTTGADLDPDGYAVTVDHGSPVVIGPSQAFNFTYLAPGTHTVALSGQAANCVLNATAARTVTVTIGQLVEEDFTIACTATRGDLAISVTTGGIEPDLDGYAVAVDGHAPTPFSGNGVFVIAGLTPGAHAAQLMGVAINCTVGGASAQNFLITAGGPRRDTTQVLFTVNCPASPMLAVTTVAGGNTDIATISATGRGLTRLTTDAAADREPAWSPDGSRIAFTSERGGWSQIWAMNADGSGQTRLSSGPISDSHPSWSPDGSRIAYASIPAGGSHADIWAMNADGSNPVPLTSGAAANSSPAWSPDGTRIAFISARDGNAELYIMNADGTGQTRITHTPEDEADPDWSPDGQQVVVGRGACYYYCTSDIVILNADGTNERQLPSSSSYYLQPKWAPDGQWIAFAYQYCDYYSCTPLAVRAIKADGTDQVQVLVDAYDPSWRR